MRNEFSGRPAPDDRTDWVRIRAMRDEDIVQDEDSPATCEADWEGAALKKNGVVVGHVKTRGPGKRPKKEQVAIRFSPGVLAAFRRTGRGWQTRMNAALEEWLRAHPEEIS